MDPLSAEYTAPISRYIGELGWQPEGSDASNVARVIWQSHSEQINLVGSLVNEDGHERLHFQAEQQQHISDFILQKTEFLKSIEDFHGNLSQLYESLTAFAQELGSSGGKLLSALRTQPLTVGGNLLGGLGDGFKRYLGEDAPAFFNRLQGKFLDWLLGSNKSVLEGVQPPENFDVSHLANFGFDVLQRVGHAQDLNLDFFKGLLQDVTGVDVNQLIAKDLPDLQSGDLGSVLSRHLASFAAPLTEALKGDITSTIVHQLLTTAATKIAAALPPGAGQVTAVLDLLYKGLQYLSDKNNVAQLQALLKSSTSGVREIVDGVVDGKPGGLSQVSNATYDILEKATGPALSFVATQLGLGSIPGKLTDIFKKLDLRSYVYVAAYKLAEKAKSFAGFGQLLPAPLSGKIPLADGQKLWEMKGKDGKAHLVIGDPIDVNTHNNAVQAADNLGNREIADLDKLDAAIKALAKKKPLTDEDRQQLIKLAEELTEKVKSLRNADTAAVKVAAASVQSSAQKTGYAAWEEVLGNRVSQAAAKDKYFRVRRKLPESQWVAAYAEYLQTKIPNMSVEDLNAVAARVAAPEPSSKGGSGKRVHSQSVVMQLRAQLHGWIEVVALAE